MRVYPTPLLLFFGFLSACTVSQPGGTSGGVPAGTIVAFAGPREAVPLGWLVCDGAHLDGSDQTHATLFGAIGYTWGGDSTSGFRLPDLGGYFLRGVTEDSTRDYGLSDRYKSLDGNEQVTDAGVGSYQLDATALPRSRVFTGGTTSSGAHVHPIGENPFPNRRPYGTLASGGEGSERQFRSNEAGNHVHGVFINRGGDRETRPVNAYVYWIIKQ
ncbi:MAG: phage tail protein [Catalinimonas sp.]